MSKKQCSINGCQNVSHARGWCSVHYASWRSKGDPEAATRRPRLPLADRISRRSVSDQNCTIWTGATTRGYGTISVNGVQKYVHRVVWELAHGPIPDGMLIDHACHNTRCCKLSHLRIASKSENGANRADVPNRESRTGVRGVYITSRTIYAAVQKDGRSHYIGSFDSVDAAARAVRGARRDLFDEFAGRG